MDRIRQKDKHLLQIQNPDGFTPFSDSVARKIQEKGLKNFVFEAQHL